MEQNKELRSTHSYVVDELLTKELRIYSEAKYRLFNKWYQGNWIAICKTESLSYIKHKNQLKMN